MCEFIITALHIHNCVFNEKMKKKILTHTPLFLYYRTSIVTTQCTSTNEIHEIRFIKKKSFVVLFKHNPEFLKLRAALGTESLFSLVIYCQGLYLAIPGVTYIMAIFILDSYVIIFFLISGQHESGNWDPSYTPGVDFLDHGFL